jgi:hypothetical protein
MTVGEDILDTKLVKGASLTAIRYGCPGTDSTNGTIRIHNK